MKLPEKIIRALPKVLLHDHLDGGLRPQTVIDLAKEIGYDKLPTTTPMNSTNGSSAARSAGACLFISKDSRIPAR